MPARRGRGAYITAAAACTAVVVFVLISVLGNGEAGQANSQPAEKHYAVFTLESPHVQSGYSTYGVRPGGEAPKPASSLPMLSRDSFNQPIALYRRYAVAQLTRMEPEVVRLKQALESGDRASAEQAWRVAYTRYLRLGAVYLTGQLAALNQQIDGTAGGLPGGVGNPSFTGLHRIEYGLWTGAPPRSLVTLAGRLGGDVGRMREMLPQVSVTPLEYGTRAHEILEDAVRDLLSGTAVPWSGEGVAATAAGVTATEEVISTLHPLLHDEEEGEPLVGPVVETELANVRAVLAAIAAAHGGRLPTNSQLTPHQAEQLDAAVGGALEALAQVPGALEAEPQPKPIRIPKADERIDP